MNARIAAIAAALVILAIMFAPSAITAAQTDHVLRTELNLLIVRIGGLQLDPTRSESRGMVRDRHGRKLERTCTPVAKRHWMCTTLTEEGGSNVRVWLADRPDGPVVKLYYDGPNPALDD